VSDRPAAALREWRETPAGQFRARLGVTDVVDRDRVEAHVEEIKAVYRERFGRELTGAEVAAVRKGGELRSVVSTGGREFRSTRELAEALGWGLSVRPRDEGVAMFVDGEWRGDPKVIAAVAEGAMERQRHAQAAHEAWANGPAVLRTIARPS
jgi:hypothetical protein